jgi:hypothetical protein
MSLKMIHAFVVISFILITLFITVGTLGTAFDRFALLTPDLGVYASFAAARDHPDYFQADPLLSHEENINDFLMIHVPLDRGLNKIFGNYGTAFVALLPVFLFTHLLGYYVLGLTLFKDPWLGLLTSLLLSLPVNLRSIIESWGLNLDVLPRFAYQSLLPFVLALSIRFGRDLRSWPILMTAVGMLNYLHPLSTPPIALALGLGLWMSASDVDLWRKARTMTFAVGLFMLVLAPFLISYLSTLGFGSRSLIDPNLLAEIIQARIPDSNINPGIRLLDFFIKGQAGYPDFVWYLVWILGTVGLVAGLVHFRGGEEYFALRSLGAWILGVFLGSGVFPIVDQEITSCLGMFSLEFDLTRGLRYLVPLILLTSCFCLVWIKNLVEERHILPRTTTRVLFGSLCILFSVLWGIEGLAHRLEFADVFNQNMNCFRQKLLICPLSDVKMDLIDVLDVTRERTPPGAAIFSEGQEPAVRFYALRPLVYSYKDGGPISYVRRGQLLTWYEQYQEMNGIFSIKKYASRREKFIKEIVTFAKKRGANYVILEDPYTPTQNYPDDLSFLYTNSHYSLYFLKP